MPRFYRVAYWDFSRDQAVCLPIGIHYLVMFLHLLWQWSFWYRPSWVDKLRFENKRLLDENAHLRKEVNRLYEQERTIGHSISAELARRYSEKRQSS